MPMKIDHITLGLKLSQARSKCLSLAASASAAYPRKDPFVQLLFPLIDALDLLKNELDRIYHGEVSDEVFDRLGHPYFPMCDRGYLEIDIGISHFRPRVRNRKNAFQTKRSWLRAVA